jgi:hypothetical protein
MRPLQPRSCGAPGYARADVEAVPVGGRKIDVVRAMITDAGRRAMAS